MSVIFTKKGGIARIILNRPEAFNSVDRSIEKDMIHALNDIQSDNNIRVVLLTGSGKAFCAGQDLKEATDPDINPGFKYLLENRYKPIIIKMTELNKPIVVAVNGVAAGAGANIALAGDIIIAHEAATFIQAFSAIGLVPDSGGTYHLPRLIGRAKAMAYCMLGDKVTAQEAERVGMIYRVFNAEEYEAEVEKLVQRLSTMPTAALALTKKMINQGYNNDLKGQLDLETEAQLTASSSSDYEEGVNAFLEKRRPQFTGRNEK